MRRWLATPIKGGGLVAGYFVGYALAFCGLAFCVVFGLIEGQWWGASGLIPFVAGVWICTRIEDGK